MCGRGRQTAPSAQAVAQALQIPIVFQPSGQHNPSGNNNNTNQQQGDDEEEDDQYSPFNNGAPGRSAPIVVEGPSSSPAVMKFARWGLVPSYQSPNTAPDHWRMFNARDDNMVNVHARLINSRRCIVPLEGFFEWENRVELGKKRKVPYFVSSPTKPQLPMAGLWDTWSDSSGKVLDTFTIITVSPSDDLKWLHDRMPAILRDEEEMRMWLNEDIPFSKVKHLVRSYSVGGLRWWPVTESIGKLGYQGDDCIKPVDLVKGTKPITNFFASKKKEPETASANTDEKVVAVPEIGIKTKDECVDLTETSIAKSEQQTKVPSARSPVKGTVAAKKSPSKSEPDSEESNRKRIKVSDFFAKKS